MEQPQPTTSNFNDLIDEAIHNPGQPVRGTLPDGWDDVVQCSVTIQDDAGAVVLDYPADRLVDAVTANLHDRDWYVTRRYATRKTATIPTKYVICVRKRNSL